MAHRPKKRVARRAVAKRSQRSIRRRNLIVARAAPRPLHNLPHQLTSFIGREKEIAEIKHLLSATRLLTLSGSGGAGKTRLALQVAADVVNDYHDGAWLAEFAPITDPALVPKTVASVLRVVEQPGRALVDTLLDALRTKTLLLILDNCEHLIAACSDLTMALLQACPHIRVLATSREGLSLPGEIVWRVPSLSLPQQADAVSSAEKLAQYDAVRLFVDRASIARPRFSLSSANASAIAQICRRLDGIPLALELAAARVKVLTVDQIAARLDDSFRLLTRGSRAVLPRHQTLWAAIDWSYRLLGEPERALFRRLSVFAGGWTLDAAEAICAGANLERHAIVDLVTSLAEKSLVLVETQSAEARYRLLETVRQFARERLDESGETAAVCRRHRDWYLALAEQAAPDLERGHNKQWIDRLESDHDNLRAALEWSFSEDDGADAGLRLAGALHWFWFERDHWSEGLQWTERALKRSDAAPSPHLTRALAGATHFAWRRGNNTVANNFGTRGVMLCRELGDQENLGVLLFHLGIVAMRQGDYERSRSLYEEALEASRAVGNDFLYGTTLVQQGILAWYQGDLKRSREFHTRSLDVLRKVGEPWPVAYALHRYGRDVLLSEGNYERATSAFVESLTLCREVGNRWIGGECLEGLGRVASALGKCAEAARLLGAAAAQRDVLGHSFLPPEQRYHNRSVEAARTMLGEVAFEAEWAAGRTLGYEPAVDQALAWAAQLKAPEPQRSRSKGPDGDQLTPREREVVELVARGLTNREIAARLVVSARTADAHVQNILNKLGFTSRAQIAAWTVERGILPVRGD